MTLRILQLKHSIIYGKVIKDTTKVQLKTIFQLLHDSGEQEAVHSLSDCGITY